MGSILIIAALVLIILFAIKSVIHRIRHGSACCGERDAPQKKIKVKDKNVGFCAGMIFLFINYIVKELKLSFNSIVKRILFNVVLIIDLFKKRYIRLTL